MAEGREGPERLQPYTPICAIGASAGGVAALQSFFRQVPDDLGLAYVVILHLAPDQPSAMDQILGSCTRMEVLQVEDGPTLRPNCVYVIPPDRELVIEGDRVTARGFSEPRGHRAPIDMFFRSVASGRGDGIAVVLSGAGSDGALGTRAIKEAGGVVMVQEPAEAAFSMMPQSAIAAGAADLIAPLARLVGHIGEVARSKEAVRSLDAEEGANDLRRIVDILRKRTGHDFSSYKRATVMRRVLRRMQVCRVMSLAEYADLLRDTPGETKELFADLLITVTMFFRDPTAFDALRRHAIKPIFDDVDEEEGVRAWVVGCATGEEAYSIAILMLEEAERRSERLPIQVFASDLDERVLATAREGRYPRSIEADVSEERLKRFFIDEGMHYRVRKEVRDAVLFASHSVLKDPPFMRLDFIACRNLLIYLERVLQEQVCSIFHYGLRPHRFLFLGSAETADFAPDLFMPTDREARIYRSRPHASAALPVLLHTPPTERSIARLQHGSSEQREKLAATLHASALEASAPPSILVDDLHNILHLSPTAGRFILHSAGLFSGRLPAVVRPELRLDLRLALNRALDQKLPMLTQQTPVTFDDETRRIALQVVPVPTDEKTAAQALVFFLDGGVDETIGTLDIGVEVRPDEMRRLHGELRTSQEALIASRSDHDVSIQELRAANEELQSLNEEYRSTAEELETSKEELQSINEELLTVNAELKSKLTSISIAHNDLQNLTASTEIGTMFLDTTLRLKMFTPPVASLFNITENDIGRAITDFTHRLDTEEIERNVRKVLADLAPMEGEVQSRDGRWYMMRLRPYRTVEDRIEGAVLTFVDITDRLLAEKKLSESEAQLRALVKASSQVLYRMSPEWGEMRELFGGGLLADTARPNDSWLQHYIPADDQGRVQARIGEAIASHGTFEMEHKVRRVDGEIGWLHSRAIPLTDERGSIIEWFGSATDVTLRHRVEEALRESESRLRTLIEGVPQLIWRAVDGGRWTWSSRQWSEYTDLTEPESRDLGWLAAIHPDDRERVMAAWHDAQGQGLFEIDCRIRSKESHSYRWFQARALPIHDDDRNIIEWLGTSTDVDDLRTLKDQQQVLVAELQHRTRNLMGVVRVIADKTMRASGDLEDFECKFRDRLGALARVNSLLARLAESDRITFDELLRTELAAHGALGHDDRRVTLKGPARVLLRSSTVQTLAMALHELSTNAIKYGALGSVKGRLAVEWRLEPPYDGAGPLLHVDWRESGVEMPAVDATRPPGSGQGRELIEKALPYQLKAKTTFVLGPDGFQCTMTIPVSKHSIAKPLSNDRADHARQES